MQRTCKNAVDHGLNDDHCDARIDCVREALDELNSDNNTIHEVTKIIETHCNDVLNR